MDEHDEMSRRSGVEAAQTIALAVLIDLLIRKGVLGKADVVEKYSSLSDNIIREGFAEGGSQVIEEILDYVAGPAASRHPTS